MTTYAIRAPDGQTYHIDGPAGASDEQVRAEVMRQHPTSASPSWSDLPGNIIPSAEKFYGNLASTVMHPIQTATNVAQSVGQIVPGMVQQVREMSPPEQRGTAPAMNTAPAVAFETAVKNRYGGAPQLKNTLITDPVGAAADASTLMMGPEAMGLRGASTAGRLAEALSKVGTAINPVAAPIAAVRAVAPATGTALAAVLGRTTNAGSAAIKQAAAAGRAGGQAAKTFRANITGAAPATDVLSAVDSKLSDAYAKRNADYQASMAPLASNNTNIDLAPIDQAIADQRSTAYGSQGDVKNAEAAGVLKDITDVVGDWRKHNLNSPVDLDEMKQRIGEIRSGAKPGTPAFRAADQIYKAVSDTIAQVAPGYADTMGDYAGASQDLNDIRAGLSLNGKAQTATKIGKLLSAMKGAPGIGDVRAGLLQNLTGPNDTEIAPALAGQSLRPIFPTGLGGAALTAGELGAGLLSHGDPTMIAKALAAGTVASPRLMGDASYFAGKLASYGQRLAALLKQKSSLTANQAALLATQMGQGQIGGDH